MRIPNTQSNQGFDDLEEEDQGRVRKGLEEAAGNVKRGCEVRGWEQRSLQSSRSILYSAACIILLNPSPPTRPPVKPTNQPR